MLTQVNAQDSIVDPKPNESQGQSSGQNQTLATLTDKLNP